MAMAEKDTTFMAGTSSTAAPRPAITIKHLGGPTALITIGGLRLLTDPTFDPPGDYPIGNRVLTKLTGPVLTPEQLGPVDAVLLSHDQHPDNLDHAGREYLKTAPLVLATTSAPERLGDLVKPLPNWETVELPRPDGGVLRITGVPAQHGPDEARDLLAETTGFVLAGDGLPTVYVSGDNASLDVVRTIAGRLGPFDIAVLFAGGAQTALLPGANLTLSSSEAAEAAKILGARDVVPIHFEGWAHFTQGPDTLHDAFQQAGLSDRLHLLHPGEEVRI